MTIPINSNWYKPKDSFWGERYLREYQSKLTPERTQKEAAIAMRLIGKPPKRVLDLACGHGRHAIFLAKAGYEVVGIDINPHFLAVAKDVAKKEGLKITFWEYDMRLVPFKSEFDAVLCLGTSFGYFETPEEDEKVIQTVARALRSGGIFIVELKNYLGAGSVFPPSTSYELSDGTKIVREREFDPLTMVERERRTTINPGGKKIESLIAIRRYLPRDLEALLKRNGLVFIDMFGDDGTAWSLESERLWMRFEKQPPR